MYLHFSIPLRPWTVCCLHEKMEFRSCAKDRLWCGLFHYHWRTTSIQEIFSLCRLFFMRTVYHNHLLKLDKWKPTIKLQYIFFNYFEYLTSFLYIISKKRHSNKDCLSHWSSMKAVNCIKVFCWSLYVCCYFIIVICM